MIKASVQCEFYDNEGNFIQAVTLNPTNATEAEAIAVSIAKEERPGILVLDY